MQLSSNVPPSAGKKDKSVKNEDLTPMSFPVNVKDPYIFQ
jgi:hypothetical protein